MLKLIQNVYGQFDLALISSKEDVIKAIVKTVVYAALFTDQLAPEDRVDDPFDRRGWWYDPTMGNGLWYARRQALTESAKRETIRMIRECLRAVSLMTDIEVTEVSEAGNVSLLVLDIRGVYDGTPWHTEFKSGLLPNKQTPEGQSIWDVEWDEDWA